MIYFKEHLLNKEGRDHVQNNATIGYTVKREIYRQNVKHRGLIVQLITDEMIINKKTV